MINLFKIKRKREFRRRLEWNGGADRIINGWKIIDIHEPVEEIKDGQEFDFYCSNDKDVYLLRIRKSDSDGYYISKSDGRQALIYLVCESNFTTISDLRLGLILKEFEELGITLYRKIGLNIKMKLLSLLLFLTLISCNSQTHEETNSNELIRITRCNYAHEYFDQIEFDITNQCINFRKEVGDKFKIHKDYDLAKYFVDSVNYSRMVAIIETYASKDKENLCDFHNEKGYVLVDLVKRGYEFDDILLKSFIVN